MDIKTVLAMVFTLLLSPFVMADNILIVMSDEDKLTLKEGKIYVTGFYFNELMEPVKQFLDAGHQITFATPTGKVPAMDPNSDTEKLFKGGQASYDTHKVLLEKLKLMDPALSPVISFNRVEQIGIDKFDAFYAPGGHAPMEDLLVNDQLGRFLTQFHEAKKPTALVCHGPIALLAALPNNDKFVQQLASGKKAAASKQWIYNGYKMTVFSNSEEEAATKNYLNGAEMKFFPQDALDIAGGKYIRGKADWQTNVVVDRELITGQNPASALGVGEAILKQLSK